MKVHRPLVNGVVQILTSVVDEGYPTDRSIDRVFRANPRWGSRDRRFVAESVYECVRWWRRLDYVTTKLSQGAGVADRVRVFGLINDWEEINPLPKPGAFSPDFQEEALDQPEEAKKLWESARHAAPGVRHAVQDWMDQLGRKEIPDRWDKEMTVLNEVAPVDLRANTLKTEPRKVMQALADEGIEAHLLKGTHEGLTLPHRKNIFSTKAFHAGLFEVQDRSSQKVAHFLDAQPGERIIDACAGAGGKSLHIAALMKNKGRVLSLDIHERKLEELRRRARRAGAGIIEARLIDSTKVVKRLAASADRLLLDVPCSGMGVLRRNPDTKLKLKPEDIDRLHATQAEILKNYSAMLKPGGTLVYATCSILPSENQAQVERFIADQKGQFVLEDQWNVWPSDRNGDGFFAAKFKKAKN